MTARCRMAGQSRNIFLPTCFDFKPSTMPLNYSGLIITWLKLIYITHIARFPSILPIIKLQAANGNFLAMTILLTLTTPAYCVMPKVRMMAKGGFTDIVYFNDFLVIGATQEKWQLAYDILLQLLVNVGFSISHHKHLTFLGIQLDTTACCLPEEKLVDLQDLVIKF